MDPEAEVRAKAIADEARSARKRPTRSMWIAALVVSIGCVTALGFAWLAERDTPSEVDKLPRAKAAENSGLGLGLLVGLGVGIVVGGLFALKKRER